MLLKRSNAPEILDNFSIIDERVDSALEELSVVNKYLGGTSATFRGLNKLTGSDGNTTYKLLDAGSGGGDIFERAAKVFKLEVYTLDKNIRACRFIKEQDGGERPICGDVLSLPFKNRSFDIVHASLFLHHFTESELKIIITDFLRLAVTGIIINDLRRNVLAYLGIKVLTALFSKSDMVKNDAPLSVKRGFTKKELKNLMEESGIKNYTIIRKWAFRWLLIIKCV